VKDYRKCRKNLIDGEENPLLQRRRGTYSRGKKGKRGKAMKKALETEESSYPYLGWKKSRPKMEE